MLVAFRRRTFETLIFQAVAFISTDVLLLLALTSLAQMVQGKNLFDLINLWIRFVINSQYNIYPVQFCVVLTGHILKQESHVDPKLNMAEVPRPVEI